MSKMTYALQAGVLKHISTVPNGLACDCICPACKSRLVARKGQKKQAHFAHYKIYECIGGYETSLHLLAKEVLEKEQCFSIPELSMPNENYESGLISKERVIQTEEVVIEPSYDGIVPDLFIKAKGRTLLIEIYVTHKVDEVKGNKVRNKKSSMIEIDLSKINREITYMELKDILINNSTNKVWVYNNVKEHCREDLRRIAKQYIVKTHGLASHTMGCPLNKRIWNGRGYANLIDDCFYCKYLFERHDYEEFEGDNHTPFVLCTGEVKVGDFKEYRQYKRTTDNN